ncbi:TVP38/TMEM64 family protein [Peribacillus cavernae]|uniref:TVP38/TMEM64 family membrane protein n=1 Tax=Peribacillus cavernae TaxID=1674310 RepID=A0A433HUL7_9BACI|nr:putative membrane protein YdjX (TVP38/TMEM64 family) [Peribacillus cavernae]RUQ32038.1 TVP38/TMEM64 family protein [Peribacillus cavernae]
MEEQIVRWFADSGGLYAIWISVFLNIVISLLGIVPSVFLTAANITFFGFTNGVIISIIGEASGAIVSFYLYRLGIHRLLPKFESNNKYLYKLQKSRGLESFLLILALRLFPLVPSGLVTLAGAISKVNLLTFAIASTIGKIPALLLEAYSVQQVLTWGWQGKIIMVLLSLFLFLIFVRRKSSKEK